MTTMVAKSRRTTYANTYCEAVLLLLHVPQQVDRGDDEARDVRAERRGKNELARRDEGNGLERLLLHRVGGRFRFRLSLRVEPRFAKLLHLRVRGPAKPGLLAHAANREIHRGVHHVRSDEPRVEDVPAALVRRLLHRAARDERAPVARLDFRIDPDLLQVLEREERL